MPLPILAVAAIALLLLIGFGVVSVLILQGILGTIAEFWWVFAVGIGVYYLYLKKGRRK